MRILLMKPYLLFIVVLLLMDSGFVVAFLLPPHTAISAGVSSKKSSSFFASKIDKESSEQEKSSSSSSSSSSTTTTTTTSTSNMDIEIVNKQQKDDEIILGPLAAAAAASMEQERDAISKNAAIGTVNERLQAELQAATDKEKYGARSAMGKKMGLDSFRSTKTDAEREAAIQEARNLNGVNPAIAVGGSFFALMVAAGLWLLTNWLAEFFAMHPVNSDVLFVNRVSAVFRNVVIGMVSLASGFFGVTGVGIFALGVRVAYGVLTGELDPTPLKKNTKAAEELDMPNVWDLMMNKKPGRRRK